LILGAVIWVGFVVILPHPWYHIPLFCLDVEVHDILFSRGKKRSIILGAEEMSHLAQQCSQLKEKLRLSTGPIGYKRLESSNELEDIQGVRRWKQDCVFCQVPFMARVGGQTIGLTSDDKVGVRCKRIHGLLPSDDDAKLMEAKMLSRTWMPSVEEGLAQQEDYPRIPPGDQQGSGKGRH
jgi:hypothetical protein